MWPSTWTIRSPTLTPKEEESVYSYVNELLKYAFRCLMNESVEEPSLFILSEYYRTLFVGHRLLIHTGHFFAVAANAKVSRSYRTQFFVVSLNMSTMMRN